jgi:hypothetical protein
VPDSPGDTEWLESPYARECPGHPGSRR